MDADEVVEAAVAGGEADGAELPPVDPPLHLAVDVAVEVLRFAGEEVDVVRGQHTVDDLLVHALEGDEEVGEQVLHTQAVVEAATVDGGGDAVRAYPIYIQAGGNGSQRFRGEHGLGGEEVVLGAEDAVGETQVVVYQELSPVGPLPNAYEVYVRGFQAVAAEVGPAVGGFGFADGGVVGLFAGGVVQFSGVEGQDVFAAELGDEGGEGAVGEEVVAVHEEDVLALGFVEAAVTGGAHAAVLLVDDLHVGVAFQQGRRAVGAAVVDDNDLAALVFLREDAVEALRQVGFGVVGRYDDGEFHKLDAMVSAMVFRVLSEDVVDVLLQLGEVGCHCLPGVVLQAGLFEEVFVLLWIALQVGYLLQEGAVVAVGVPEEDGVVVEDVGFGVAVGTPVDGYAAGAYAVEEFLGDVALDRGVLRADVEAVLLQEFDFVVVELRLQLVGVVQQLARAVDGGDGVELLHHVATEDGSGVVGAAVAGDQGAEAFARGIKVLVAQLFANATDVLLGRFRREHLQYP